MLSIPKTPNVFIQGPAGDLEAAVNEVEGNRIAIVCHPHPLYGGTMNNKVVTTIARAFMDCSFSVVRFNFRGVGKSEGVFAEGVGEVDDVLAVIEWVGNKFPDKQIYLAGFSFGAAMSAKVAARMSIGGLISVAPPVPRFDLMNLGEINCPWLVVQGDKDDVVNYEDVKGWVETRMPAPSFLVLAEAGHFFHGRLMELREILEDWINHAVLSVD